MLEFKISDLVLGLDYYGYDNINKDMFIETYLYKYLADYVCESQKLDYTIKLYREKMYIEEGKHISSGWHHNLYKIDDTIRYAFYQLNEYTYAFDILNNWGNAEIIDYVEKEKRLSDMAFVGFDVGIYLYLQGLTLHHDSFFIHGVSLQYKNKGLIFSAGSGVGKTTHTNFWADKFGAEILNGDSPIIKFVDEKSYIYGSPWCGSSDISVNKNIPLDVIVILTRGIENKIRKLSKVESVKYLFPHIRRPVWDIELTNICLDYCEKIADTVSIYHLECLPNEESVEIALAGIEELHE